MRRKCSPSCYSLKVLQSRAEISEAKASQNLLKASTHVKKTEEKAKQR